MAYVSPAAPLAAEPILTAAPVPLCMFLFGLITTMQGLVQNLGGLIATRFFLGAPLPSHLPANRTRRSQAARYRRRRERRLPRVLLPHRDVVQAGGGPEALLVLLLLHNLDGVLRPVILIVRADLRLHDRADG